MLWNAPLATGSGTAPTFVRPCWMNHDAIPAPPLFAARVGRSARCAAGIGSIMAAHSSQEGGTESAPAARAPSGAFDQAILERVQSRKQRRAVRNVLYGCAVAMWVGAAALMEQTNEIPLVEGSLLALLAAVLSYKHFILDGCGRDSAECVALPAESFEVRESEGRGLGLFCARHIRKGSFLFRYDGERINDLEFERRYASDPFSDEAGYVMRINDDEFIDGSSAAKSGVARYINHAKGLKCNVEKFIAQRKGGSCCFFAKRDLCPGEELFFDYSDEYWQAKGVIPMD